MKHPEQDSRSRMARKVVVVAVLASISACLDGNPVAPPMRPTVDQNTPGTVQELPDSPDSIVVASSASIGFVSATGNQTANSNRIELDRPAGLQQGDVMIAQVVSLGNVQVSQVPADWTLIRGDYNGTHSNSYVYWKRAGALEPASYTWNFSSSSQVAGGVAAYRNVVGTGNPIDVHGGQHNSASINIVAPSVTTTTQGAYLIATFSAASDTKETSLSFSPPSGMLERYDLSSQRNGNFRNVVAMHASAALAAVGATGTRTAVLSAARPGWGQLVALKPAPAPPPVASITVTPATHSFSALGQTQQFTAVAYDGNGNVVPNVSFTWSSTAAEVAGVDAAGLVTAQSNGNATIRASAGAVTGTASVTVAQQVASVTVTPPTHSFSALGQTQQFGAVAYDGNGNAVANPTITWSSTAPAIVSIGESGLATAQALGTAEVRASVGEVVGSATVSVGQSVASITVSPTSHSFTALGQTQQFTAVALDAQGNAVPNVTFTWSSSAPAVAGVNASGLVTAAANGMAEIRASVGEVVGAAAVTVNQQVASISLAPPTHAFSSVGQTQQFTATALDSNGNAIAGASFIWSSTAPGIVSVNAGGLATAVSSGSAEVRASVGEITGSAAVSVLTAPPIPVSWIWSGGQSANGAMVKARLDSPSNDVRLRVSSDSLFGTFTETATAFTQGNNVVTFNLSGLSPTTRYHYRPVVGGVADASKQGAFNTLPTVGTAYSFSFAFGACQRTESNIPVFDHIRAANPLFWMQAGDIHYSDFAVNNIELFRGAYNTVHAQSRQAALYRRAPIVYMWDDHDGGGGNDGDRTGAGWPAARAAYRENAPHQPLVEGPGGAIYHSFVVGRVRFIVSDLRSERSPKSAPDNGSKTMLGAAQKQHFFNELAAARANNQFVAWVTSVPWINAPGANQDSWGGYDTERREIAAYIESLGISGQMFALSGDMHGSAIDSGINNVWGSFPVFHAAPIDQSGSEKGGPYSHGPWTNGVTGEQFGIVTITDNGGDWINVTFSARRNGSQIPGGSYQFTRTLSGGMPPPIVAVSISPTSHTFTAEGQTQLFTATGVDANGTPVAGQFTWSSSAPQVASVTNGGFVTAHANGTAWIRAQTGTAIDSVRVTVAAPVITSIQISPNGHTFAVIGQTQQFTATAYDAFSSPVPAAFNWSSSNASVASVSASGLALANGAGTAWIRAQTGSVIDSVLVEVVAPEIASISISPASHTFSAIGQTRTFTATARDAGGNPVPAAFSWSSSQPSIAVVSQAGVVSATAIGAAWIRVQAGSVSDSASVTVAAPSSYTDFGNYATGVRPSDWSAPYSSVAYTVQELAEATGGKVLEYTTPAGSDAGIIRALRWNTVGNLLNVEIEALARVTAASVRNDGLGLIARGSGSGTSGTFYSSRLDSDVNDFVIRRYVNGGANTLARWRNTHAKGTLLRQRFRVEAVQGGTLLRLKVWPEGTAEPAEWTISVVDTATPLEAGFVGVFMQRREATNQYDTFRATPLP